MGVSNGRIVCFPWLLGEGWGHESASDGVDQLGMCHIVLFSIGANCLDDQAVDMLRSLTSVDQRRR